MPGEFDTAVPVPADVLTAWSFAPGWDALLLAGTVGYLLLAHRLRRRGESWPHNRVAAWWIAVVLLFLTVNASIEVFSQYLFWVHMIQHLLLIMVVPVLLVWAQPLRLLHLARSKPGRDAETSVRGGRFGRILTAPALTIALYTAVVVLTHLTGFQEQALRHPYLHTTEMALYLISGYLLFLTLIGHDRAPWTIPYLLRFVVLAVTMGVDTMVGVVLMLTNQPLAPGFAARHPGWGLDAIADQSTAGAIMWFGGDGLMMILMVITAIEWGGRTHQNDGLGSWLEGVRRRQILGEGDPGADDRTATPRTDDGAGGDGGPGDDVDLDQQVLDAYNAHLIALHERERPSPRPHR